MKLENLIKCLIDNGWSLSGDSESGIAFVNVGAEIELLIEDGVSYLRFGGGLRMKEVEEVSGVSFSHLKTIILFSDGSQWEYDILDTTTEDELEFATEDEEAEILREMEADGRDMRKGKSRTVRQS